MGYVGEYIWIVGGVGFVVGGGASTALNRLNNDRELFEVRSPIG